MDIFLSIASNGALLLSLTFLYSLLIPYIRRIPRWLSSTLTGLLFGAFALLNMLQPMYLGAGVMVDPRNVILMVAAAVGGLRAGLLSLVLVAAYRLYLGGIGVGVGLASMFTAVLIGVAYERWQQKRQGKKQQSVRFDRYTIGIGLLVGLESLFWTLLLPNGYGWTLMPSLAWPVLTIYAAVTYLMLWLIASAYQRIELSAALQESEGRLWAIFAQSLQFLCIMESDGRVCSLNTSLENAAQLPRAAILGKPFWEVPWPFLDAAAAQSIRTAIESASTGHINRLQLDLSAKTGTMLLDIALQKIAETGQILMEARDVSEQVQGEKRRLELQFERERNDILQQLIGDASHHLRTPLSVFNTSLYLLRKQFEQQNLSPEVESKLLGQFKKLDAARQELVDIVEDLLSMMRLDSAAAFRFEPVLLAPYLSEILESYRDIAEEKQIGIVFEPTDSPVMVSLATSSFRRVVGNLLENALRYTAAGGTIRLRFCEKDGLAEICVEDTGIGIPQEDLARIFDRFYRAKNASNIKGTGLGLAIVKKTLELHKGQIAIESEVGKGTRMIVRLPMLATNVLAAG